MLLYIILREVTIMLTSRIYSAFFSFAIAISLKTPDPSQMKGRSYPDILMEQRMRKEEVETIFIRCFFTNWFSFTKIEKPKQRIGGSH